VRGNNGNASHRRHPRRGVPYAKLRGTGASGRRSVPGTVLRFAFDPTPESAIGLRPYE
jgi:hypothetical protein